jgi:predicted ATPase/class 3 adenylate cyclase
MDHGDRLTFFFSDIEGSTRAAATLGPAFASAIQEHRGLVRDAIAASDGREVSTAGDSFFAVFADADAALRAAVTIQRTTAAGSPLRARIGLHTGQAVVIGDDYVGLDVHRAARIADAGHGGQILLSETAQADLVDVLDNGLTLVDLGRHRLKDVGPERLWEVHGEGLPAGPFPPPRSLEAHPTNLPPRTALVDRDRERSELPAMLERASVVTVTGPGGIGKSRLAVEVAHALVDRFPDGVFHLDLAGTPDAAAVVGGLADMVGFRTVGEEPLLPGLLERLRSRDLLFVLDTADRVEGLANLVAVVAASCPRIRLLVTTRSRLRITAEREYAVGPLGTADAVTLFETRAAEVRPGFTLDDETRRAVERLVERLDFIPLAIELAAARARLFSPAVILDRLERQLPALGEGSTDAPDRQRTLHATIAWSCELLQPMEQSVFAQLGVFSGFFDLPAAEAVLEVEPGTDPVTQIEQLVDRSLVVTEDAAPTRPGGPSLAQDGPRFRLLAPIREFAMAALAGSGLDESVRERHARYFLDVVRRESDAVDATADLAALERLRAVDMEIRAALAWTLADPTTPDRALVGLELAGRLGQAWYLRGHVLEGLGWLRRCLTVAVDAPAADRARALQWAGILADGAGLPEEGRSHLQVALELRRELGDEVAVARVLNSLGAVARSMGDLPLAERLMRESLEQKLRLGDRRGTATSLSNLGLIASDRGRLDEAAELMRQAFEIDVEFGGSATVVGEANLGSALVRAGRHREGLVHLRRVLPDIAELGDPELVVEALASVGEAVLASETPGARRSAALLVLAADHIRQREQVRLHDPDVRQILELRQQATADLGPALPALEAEAGALDTASAIALARRAADELEESDSA